MPFWGTVSLYNVKPIENHRKTPRSVRSTWITLKYQNVMHPVSKYTTPQPQVSSPIELSQKPTNTQTSQIKIYVVFFFNYEL